MSENKLNEAKQEHEPWLKIQPGFKGVGIGVDQSAQPCIVVFTNKMSKDTKESIRKKMAEVNLAFEEIGSIRKF